MSEDVDALLRDLRAAPAELARDAAGITSRTALEVKKQMQGDARAASPRHAPHFPASITYDLDVVGGEVSAEVGPDKALPGAQGALGNVLAFGTRNNAPVWDLEAPMRTQMPLYEKHLADAAASALDRR